MENRQEAMETEGNNRKPEKGRRRISDSFIVIMLLSFLFVLIGQILGSILVLFIPFLIRSDAGVMIAAYLSFIGIWIVALLYMRFTKKNRPILQVLWKKPAGNRPVYLLYGLGIGFALNGFCILIAWLNKDIALYYDGFEPVWLVLFFIAVFIQSAAEEMVCRGFAYQRFLKSYGKPWIAIAGNSMMFGLFHLPNQGITVLSLSNIILTGVFCSLVVYYMDSLWCAMGIHAAWNFTQNVLFGLPNSGIVSAYSLFKLDASTARDSFAYNVGFGIEGTVVADLVLLAACVLIYLWGRKYGRKPFAVWEEA